MSKKVLVAYATNSGSTKEVAQVIGETFEQKGARVDVIQIGDISDMNGYQAVLVVGPMIVGWHRTAIPFLKKNRKVLCHLNQVIFVTGKLFVDGHLRFIYG